MRRLNRVYNRYMRGERRSRYADDLDYGSRGYGSRYGGNRARRGYGYGEEDDLDDDDDIMDMDDDDMDDVAPDLDDDDDDIGEGYPDRGYFRGSRAGRRPDRGYRDSYRNRDSYRTRGRLERRGGGYFQSWDDDDELGYRRSLRDRRERGDLDEATYRKKKLSEAGRSYGRRSRLRERRSG